MCPRFSKRTTALSCKGPDYCTEAAAPALSRDAIWFWLEFSSWTILVVAPLLYWVNGPSVSLDQYVVRTILLAMTLCVAASARIRAWFCSPQTRRVQHPGGLTPR